MKLKLYGNLFDTWVINQFWNIWDISIGFSISTSVEVLWSLTGLDLFSQLFQDLKVFSTELRQDLWNKLSNWLFNWVTSERETIGSWSTLDTNSVKVQNFTIILEEVSFLNTFNLGSLQFTQSFNQFGVILFSLNDLLSFNSRTTNFLSAGFLQFS
ncbi:hypothetical protein CTRG_03479 [Candida tropicalis MYA-3404]|uniref:Uncharacterized protein n=1 Tax=Candida tropicalis (strain ATCC MYA-3404 / T1) TaxID=294747 RepID=C5MBN7_CANTT|nr:hypothetical protein CTRG_03479 [Candida tropicalis MYA-3404]EER33054.1 hypothetical protein CTRG_03479 [Candida tropicalis MYA-3404]KAG4406883.1 hypothetical protein JTP64_004267 [Candida tropicalis]